MLGAFGFANTGVTDAGVEESALTRVVRAVVDIATRKTARLIEGVCVDCMLAKNTANAVSDQRSDRFSAGGSPGSEPHFTQQNLYPNEEV